jgi:hypothetical protein
MPTPLELLRGPVMGFGVALPAGDELGSNAVDYFLDRAPVRPGTRRAGHGHPGR